MEIIYEKNVLFGEAHSYVLEAIAKRIASYSDKSELTARESTSSTFVTITWYHHQHTIVKPTVLQYNIADS